MSNLHSPTLLGFVLLSSLVGVVRAEQDVPKALRGVRIEQRLGAQVPGELEFRDETGRTVHLQDYFNGKPHVLVLAYYRCPKLCTLVLNGLRAGMQSIDAELQIGDDFNVITVSFDPRETPPIAAAKKANYVAALKKPQAAGSWHFLTGEKPAINRLTEATGFYYAQDPETQEFAHASTLIILTPEGKVSSYLLGVQYLPKDLRLSLVEASGGKVGSPVDQALLYCFHYDPQAGKYTADVLFFVRLGGMTVLAALAAFGVVMWRRERKRSR